MDACVAAHAQLMWPTWLKFLARAIDRSLLAYSASLNCRPGVGLDRGMGEACRTGGTRGWQFLWSIASQPLVQSPGSKRRLQTLLPSPGSKLWFQTLAPTPGSHPHSSGCSSAGPAEGWPAIVRQVRPMVGNFDARLLEKPGGAQALPDG